MEEGGEEGGEEGEDRVWMLDVTEDKGTGFLVFASIHNTFRC